MNDTLFWGAYSIQLDTQLFVCFLLIFLLECAMPPLRFQVPGLWWKRNGLQFQMSGQGLLIILFSLSNLSNAWNEPS